MLANKWILFALSLAVAIVSYLSTVDWHTLLPSEAGGIVAAIGLLKAVLSAVMPPTTQPTITATGSSLFTHT